jgi:peptide-N4-(N-acetyl-beta-glucosaminyl)asparagine amidase
VNESWLAGYLRHLTTRLRAELAPEERLALEQRDALDLQHILSSSGSSGGAVDEALPARTTGDAAWLAQRGEDGRSRGSDAPGAVAPGGGEAAAAGAAAGPAPDESSGTRYRLAKDERLREAHPLRLCGGAVRASGENAPAEVAAAAFDGRRDTKWLEFRPRGSWLEYRLPAEQPPAALESYALTAANDFPERDPRHVMLEAFSEGGLVGGWVGRQAGGRAGGQVGDRGPLLRENQPQLCIPYNLPCFWPTCLACCRSRCLGDSG